MLFLFNQSVLLNSISDSVRDAISVRKSNQGGKDLFGYAFMN